MPITTVVAGFETYRTRVIPDHAPKIQEEECRRAFYAGAYHMLMNCFTAVGSDEIPEEEGIAALEGLKTEIETYVASLQPGYTFPDAPAAPALRLVVAPDISYTTDDPDHIKPKLQALGGVIGDLIPASYGFLLMIFNFGAGGNLFYISNADRADVIVAIQNFLRKQIS